MFRYVFIVGKSMVLELRAVAKCSDLCNLVVIGFLLVML